MIYLIELGAHTGAAAVTLRVATASYVTQPTDNPANAVYYGRVADPGNFEAFLFSAGRTGGPSEVGHGEIVVNNPDGKFDAWIDYGFDGRPVRILTVPNDRTPYAEATLIFRGAIEQIVTARALNEFRFRIYDRRLDIDKPLQTVRYAGTTTSAGNTAEGTVDLKDQVKPLAFGKLFNVPLVCVNPFNLLYQAGANAASTIVEVYDGGVPLTATADYASIAALNAAALTPGKFATCLALGLVRLGGVPEFSVTADLIEGATSADRTAAQIVKRMLTRMGLSAADYVEASFAALDALNAAECGIYIDGEMSGLDAMQRVLSSVGGYIVPNAAGQFEVGRLSAPGTPLATLRERDMLGDVEFLATDDDGGGIPAYRVVLRYRPVWLVQDDSDLAGCVDAEYRAFVAAEYREQKAESISVQTKYLLAPELKFDTLLADQPAALSEATRRLGLYSVRRDRIRATFWRDKVSSLKRGDTVSVVINRLGYNAGRPMVITGMRMDNLKSQATLELWG